MTKQQSVLLKGIALLMMFFVHVNWANYENFIQINGVPLLSYLSKLSTPVEIFTVLGGYGLCFVHQNNDKHHFSRIVKLYIHYWIIITVFCFIGHFVEVSGKYPGSFSNILFNYSSFYSSWNYECWFLFPYAILSLSYPLIFRLYDKAHPLVVFFIALLLFGIAGYCISVFHIQYKESSPLLYNGLYLFYLLFPFSLGYLLKRAAAIERVAVLSRRKPIIKLVPYLLLIVFVIIKLHVNSSLFSPFYALGIIAIIALLIKTFKPLEFVGKHSMNMWMIHTWFIYYLFPSFFKGLKYSIVLLMVLFILCVVCSMTVNFIARPLELKCCNGKR